MFCTKCGNQLPNGSAFCNACGAPTSQQPQQQTPVQPSHPIQQPILRPMSRKKQAKLQTAQRIAENKAEGVACCPKCGSTSLSANKKGFGVGKAVLGAGAMNILLPGVGLIGAVAGNAGAKKLWVTCLNCGNRWKL